MGSRPLRAVAVSEGEKRKKTLLVARRSSPEESAAQIVVLDPCCSSSKPLVLETGDFTGFGRIAVVAGASGDGVASLAVVAAQPTAPAALVEAKLNFSSPSPSSSSLSWSVVARSSDLQGIEGFVSTPRVVKFPTGKNKEEFAYLNFYPPASAAFALPPGERPPLIVKIHGGERFFFGTLSFSLLLFSLLSSLFSPLCPLFFLQLKRNK